MKLRLTAVPALALLVSAPAPAQDNHALFFDGADDYVVTGESLDLGGTYTLEAWVNLASIVSAGRVLSTRNGANGYEMDIVDDGASGYELRVAHNGGLRGNGPFAPGLNTSAHVAAAFDGATLDLVLYVNGEVVDSQEDGEAYVPSGSPLHVGSMGTTFFNFHGAIDEVRVWSTVLDQGTLQEWMGRTVTPDHPSYGSLEGYWTFDEGAGQTAASEVESPARDGQLGATAGADATDPVWEAGGAPVPVARTTFGRIKARREP